METSSTQQSNSNRISTRVRARNAELTALLITSLKPGEWASDSSVRGAGQLQVRCLTHGAPAFYYRYTNIEGKQVRLPLGTGLLLADARLKATSLSRLYQEGERDLRSALRVRSTSIVEPPFSALLLAYVEDLRARERSSAQEVHNALKRHVKKSWPELWKKPLSLITTDDILLIIRTVVDKGKLREADKVRTYIRAAFGAAIQARQSASGLPKLQILKVSTNPARDIPAIRFAKRVKERALSLSELRSYWQHIEHREGAASALLRFHLLTGGQRVKQLGRATLENYDPECQTLTLHDPKGRRLDARVHMIPLLPEATEEIKKMRGGVSRDSLGYSAGEYLWSVTAGCSGACYSTADKALKAVIKEIPKEMFPGGAFTLGDLRRTIETRLAAAGVSREVRAQLQSHGLSGVQNRHYDRYEYLPEKRGALITLQRLFQTHAEVQTSAKTQIALIPKTDPDVEGSR